MSKLSEEQLKKRRKINKKIFSIFGILLGMILIGAVISPTNSEQKIFDKYYPTITEKLTDLSYVDTKKSDKFAVYNYKIGDEYNVVYGFRDKYKDLIHYDFNFLPKDLMPTKIDTIKQLITTNTRWKGTINLGFNLLTNGTLSIQDIVNGLDGKNELLGKKGIKMSRKAITHKSSLQKPIKEWNDDVVLKFEMDKYFLRFYYNEAIIECHLSVKV